MAFELTLGDGRVIRVASVQTLGPASAGRDDLIAELEDGTFEALSVVSARYLNS